MWHGCAGRPPVWIPAFAGMTRWVAGTYPGSGSGTCFHSNRSCRLAPAHQGVKSRSCGLVQRIGTADSATPHPDPSGGQAHQLQLVIRTILRLERFLHSSEEQYNLGGTAIRRDSVTKRHLREHERSAASLLEGIARSALAWQVPVFTGDENWAACWLRTESLASLPQPCGVLSRNGACGFFPRYRGNGPVYKRLIARGPSRGEAVRAIRARAMGFGLRFIVCRMA